MEANVATLPETAPTGPQIYSAADVALERQRLAPPRAIPEPLDPLRSFENDSTQTQTDLKLWHTMRVEDRVSRLSEMENDFATELWRHGVKEGDAAGAFKVREARWRAYSYLVWLEAKPYVVNDRGHVLPKGNKDIALKLAELLFTPLQPRAPQREADALARAAAEAKTIGAKERAFKEKVGP